MTLLSRVCSTALFATTLAAGADDAKLYEVAFSAHFVPDDGAAEVRIDIRQSHRTLIQLNFAAPPDRYSGFEADGNIARNADRVTWRVPPAGGRLVYRTLVDNRRGSSYDARMTGDWVLLRLDDLFPPARARSLKGARSVSTLNLTGPPQWSFESRYGPIAEPRAFSEPDRRFDRPTGWMVGGFLGVRRDLIAGRRVAVAGPRGEGVRRIDNLAFLHWTLPALIDVFPTAPERLLIVGAQSGMWRGGLSGPDSLYLHSGQPLISENGTSPLLHELVHVATSKSMDGASDWIVEGLAEYYSLEILRRTGGISERRFEAGIGNLRAWAIADGGGLRDPSRGAHTARAAVLFTDLADELAEAGRSLDELVRLLTDADVVDVDVDVLNVAAEQLLRKPSETLAAFAAP